MHSQGPLADAAELVRLTELWLRFDAMVWSRSRVTDLRGMGPDALTNLAELLKEAREGLKQLQSRAREARTLAESLLAGLPK